MKRVLITGMSGVGKSTTIDALRDRGFAAYDADYDGLSTWGRNPSTGEPEWLWDVQPIRALLDADHGTALFLCGTAVNQGKFRARFDHVVLLTAPDDVMVHRLRSRTNNPYGKDPAERERALQLKQTIEPLLCSGSTLKLSTDRPVADVVDAILDHAGLA